MNEEELKEYFRNMKEGEVVECRYYGNKGYLGKCLSEAFFVSNHSNYIGYNKFIEKHGRKYGRYSFLGDLIDFEVKKQLNHINILISLLYLGKK